MATLNSNKKNKHPKIFGCFDYRELLRDFYQAQKLSEEGFSFREFSKTAGFSSPNFMKLVIDGKRSIGPSSIAKVARALNLNEKESEYFSKLVRFNESQNEAERREFFDDLRSMSPRGSQRILEEADSDFVSNWLCPVLFEMIQLKNFRADLYSIMNRLQWNVSTNEIQKSLHLLIKRGFVVRNREGVYLPSDKMLSSTDEIPSTSIRAYHRQILRVAEIALEKLPVSEREFNSLVMALPKESLKILKKKIKAFVDDTHEWSVTQVEGKKADTVIQFNIQMFPHIK